jgi:hypothetical protein
MPVPQNDPRGNLGADPYATTVPVTNGPMPQPRGSAKPGNAGPMPQQGSPWGAPPNAFAGGSQNFNEAAGPGLPSWAGGGGGGGPPQAPPGYIYDPDITGGFVQNNPFTGSGAMQGPTPYQPGVDVVAPQWWMDQQQAAYDQWQAGQGQQGAGAITMPTPGNGPGGAPNPAFPTGPLGPVPPQGGPGAGLASGVVAGGNPLGAVPPQGGGLGTGAPAGTNPYGGGPPQGSGAPGLMPPNLVMPPSGGPLGAPPAPTAQTGGAAWEGLGGPGAIPGGGAGPSSNSGPPPGFGTAPNLGGNGSWNGGGMTGGGGGLVNGVYTPPGSGGGSYSGSGGYQGGSSTPYGINPADIANPNPQNFGNWQEFEDNAYAGFVRQLDPQWAERERQLAQELNNRGIPQGSEAWTQAMSDFNQGRNDAYGQARQQAQQAGLAAQNQAFGQNAIESQLANALLRSQQDYDARMAGVGAQNNSTNAQLQQALASLGLQRDLGFGNMGLQRELGLYGVGLDYDRLGFAQDQAGFGNLMQLLNFGFGANQYNNQLLDSDFNRGLPLFGMVPQVSPGQVDVTGPYGQAQNWAAYLGGNAQDQQNGLYQGLGGIFQMLPYLFPSDDRTSQVGPLSGGYGYPGGGYNPFMPWTAGINYGQWPGG